MDQQFDALAREIDGRVITPQHDDYDAARAVWNGMIDERPAVLVQCESVDDAAAALAHARERGMPMVVRGGGHSVAGRSTCDGGMVIDLGPMRDVTVDPEARIARVQPGARGRELDAASQVHGLATTGGTDSTTGVIGLTLGGGMGFLGRAFGLASDNVVGADVLLADGTRVHASESEHPDLFWALRGGGGNFGIVTELQLRLHPVGPQVMSLQAFHPFEAAPEGLRLFRDFMADAPDAVGGYGLALMVPPVDPFPAEWHGRTALALVASHAGTLEEGERDLKPLAEWGAPIFQFFAPMEYTALQQSFDAGAPAGQRYFWKSQYLEGLPDEAIDAFVSHADPPTGPFTAAYFEPLGGAFGRVDPMATAFPHRSAPFNVGISSGWADPVHDDEGIRWTRSFHEAMSPWSTGGMYANYLGTEDLVQPRAVYGDNLERLRQVKERYDPDEVISQWLEAVAR